MNSFGGRGRPAVIIEDRVFKYLMVSVKGCVMLPADWTISEGNGLTMKIYRSGVNSVGMRGRSPVIFEDSVGVFDNICGGM